GAGPSRLHETTLGRENGTLPIPSRSRTRRHGGPVPRRDPGDGVQSEGPVSDRPGHGAGDLGRVRKDPWLSPPCCAGQEVQTQEGNGDWEGPQDVRPELRQERVWPPS